MIPKVGNKVKFKDELWEEKRKLGMDGWLAGFDMSPDHPNEFIIYFVNEQDENVYELILKDYPWFAYFDEMELIDDEYDFPEVLASILLSDDDDIIEFTIDDFYDFMNFPIEDRTDFGTAALVNQANQLYLNTLKDWKI